jgi:peptide/nickel transport system substrate-binding protein
MPTQHTRRGLLRLFGLASVGLVAEGLLTTCRSPTPPAAPPATTAPATTAAPTANAGSAPLAKPTVPASEPTQQPAAGTPKQGGILKIALNQEANTVDPHKQRDIAGTHIKGMVYSQLIKYGRDLEIQPDLAERWENPDSATYVFHLRRGVKFHDGADLTADDVVASYERLLDPSIGAPVYVFIKNISSVTARDPNTVVFKLGGPQATFIPALALAGQYIAQKAKVQANANFETDLVGTGPFRFVSRTPGVETKLERNLRYFVQSRPFLDGLSYRPIFDDSARMNALRSGDVDLATYVTWAAMSEFNQYPQLALHSQTAGGYVQLDLRVDQPPLDNVKVRQAMSYAINYDQIIQELIQGKGRRLRGPLAFGMEGYDENLKGYDYDPAKAKQLLADAGLGSGFDLTLTYSSQGAPGADDVAQAAQSNLGDVGIRVKIEKVAEPTRRERIDKSDFVWSVGGWTPPLPTPPWTMDKWYLSDNRGLNRAFYSNPKVDELVKQAPTILDAQKRIDTYRQAQNIMVDEAPYILFYQANQILGMRDNIQGFEIKPGGSHYLSFEKLSKT